MGANRKYNYGRTFISYPPTPKEQRIVRIVQGNSLEYVRVGNTVKIYDGTKQLHVPVETQRRIIAAWPQDDDTTDFIDWWGE